MSLFPRIARPCPYIDRLGEVMEGDFCRMCSRQVHDLTDMNDTERAAFLSTCGGDACVSYIAMVRPAVAAAMVAMAAAVLVVPDPALARQHKKGAVVRKQPPPYLIPMATAGLPPLMEPPPPVTVPTPVPTPPPAAE